MALIGNGSSGVQILPELQKRKTPFTVPECDVDDVPPSESNQVIHFVRDPTWIVPSRLQLLAQGGGGGILSEIEMNPDETFSDAQIKQFESDPAFYRRFVKATEEVVNGNFPLVSLSC